MMKRKTIHGQNGTSLIEFSLVLPLIIILVLGMIGSELCAARSTHRHQADPRRLELISRDTHLPTAAKC